MTTDLKDKERRKFLTGATAVIGGIGMSLAAVPFVSSWLPSEKAKSLGGPVELDVSTIAPGEKVTVSWRGQPVFVVHRTQQMIKELSKIEGELSDPKSLVPQQPDYAKNNFRAINEKYLVIIGICTHLGCVPLYKPKPASVDPNWTGGFFCPCHGSKYDLAGRVYKSVPAPTNLSIPPHHYINESTLLIGMEA